MILKITSTSNRERCRQFKTISRQSQQLIRSLSKILSSRSTKRTSLRKKSGRLLTLSTIFSIFVPNKIRGSSHLVKTIESRRTPKTSFKSWTRNWKKLIKPQMSFIKFTKGLETNTIERRLMVRLITLKLLKTIRLDDLGEWTPKND